MDETPPPVRFDALDGVRGIAIILVVLTHFYSGAISALLPPILGQLIFGSGITGVSLLFILSGFLMAYIYPHPKRGLDFLQKRYTRIFPLFLSLAAANVLLRQEGGWNWIFKLSSILVLALFANFIWVQVIKRFTGKRFKRLLFLSFLASQVVVGAVYVFWIGKQPPVYLNHQLPGVVREGFIGMVNATLTLPLGTYVPMLDGVYWSLAAEVLFYILYPVICVPLIEYLRPLKRSWKILGLLLLLPFFGGLYFLSHRILSVSMLHLELAFYFPVGITVGYLFRYRRDLLQRFLTPLLQHWKPLSIVVFFLFLGAKTTLFNLFAPTWYPWIHMLWAFPFALLLMLALDQRTLLSKFLSSKTLVFLGTISYSMYLSHTAILHIVEEKLPPSTPTNNLTALILSFTLTIIFSLVLHELLEKPYFTAKQGIPQQAKESPKVRQLPNRAAMVVIAVILIAYPLAVFSAYQSNFNFLSVLKPLDQVVVISPTLTTIPATLSMKDYNSVKLEFTSPEDNLRLLTMHLTVKNEEMVESKEQMLNFSFKEKGAPDWMAINSYRLAEIGDSPQHPFGFPLLTGTKGKVFVVELSLSDSTSGLYLDLDLTSLKGVYRADKSYLLTHPLALIAFVGDKVGNTLAAPGAQTALVLYLPFASFLLLVGTKRKNGKLAKYA